MKWVTVDMWLVLRGQMKWCDELRGSDVKCDEGVAEKEQEETEKGGGSRFAADTFNGLHCSPFLWLFHFAFLLLPGRL